MSTLETTQGLYDNLGNILKHKRKDLNKVGGG